MHTATRIMRKGIIEPGQGRGYCTAHGQGVYGAAGQAAAGLTVDGKGHCLPDRKANAEKKGRRKRMRVSGVGTQWDGQSSQREQMNPNARRT